jgi:hypothetical protein
MKQVRYMIANLDNNIILPFESAQNANEFLRKVDAGGKRGHAVRLFKQTVEEFGDFFPAVESSPATGQSAAEVINGLKTKP